MKKIFMLLATIGLLYSCSDDDSNENINVSEDFVTLSADTLSAGPQGGDVEVTIESSEDWTLIGPKVEWATPSINKGKSGQTLTFKVEANETGEELENTYKIFAGSNVKKLVVISNPTMKLELLSEDNVSINSEKNTINISLSTNITNLSYEFSDNGEQWIKVSSFESAFGKETLVLEANANDTYISRSSTLKITGEDKSVSINIQQSQLDGLLADGEEYKETDLSECDIQFNIKTNIEYQLGELPEWIQLKETTKGETVDGLQKQTLTFHVSEAMASRRGDIYLLKDSKLCLTLTIKQQNPNPIMITIPDKKFREALSTEGWVILGQEDDIQCEVIEKGLKETVLDLDGTYWSNYGIESIEGIEQFPQIEVLKLAYNNLTTVDISKLKHVKELNIESIYPLTSVITGDNPVTSLRLQDYIDAASLTISGNNITDINAYLSSWMSFYDKLETLDVTGCPKLKTCNVDRQNLKTLYVTQEQKENVAFTNQGSLQIVVK